MGPLPRFGAAWVRPKGHCHQCPPWSEDSNQGHRASMFRGVRAYLRCGRGRAAIPGPAFRALGLSGPVRGLTCYCSPLCSLVRGSQPGERASTVRGSCGSLLPPATFTGQGWSVLGPGRAVTPILRLLSQGSVPILPRSWLTEGPPSRFPGRRCPGSTGEEWWHTGSCLSHRPTKHHNAF